MMPLATPSISTMGWGSRTFISIMCFVISRRGTRRFRFRLSRRLMWGRERWIGFAGGGNVDCGGDEEGGGSGGLLYWNSFWGDFLIL